MTDVIVFLPRIHILPEVVRASSSGKAATEQVWLHPRGLLIFKLAVSQPLRLGPLLEKEV